MMPGTTDIRKIAVATAAIVHPEVISSPPLSRATREHYGRRAAVDAP
jgi:hypothetical protein